MKKFILCTAIAFAGYGCSSGVNDTGSETKDTTSQATGYDDMGRDGSGTAGMESGTDTTGLDVGVVQPVDSAGSGNNGH